MQTDSMHIREFIIQISLNSDGLEFFLMDNMATSEIALRCIAGKGRAADSSTSGHRSVQHSCPVAGPSNYCFVNLVYPYKDTRANMVGVSFQCLLTESGEGVNTEGA